MLRSIYVSLLLCLGLAACVDDLQTDDEALTFIHLNDTYRVDAVEEGRHGGFSRVATLVRRLQSEGREVRILHGGDFLYPSLESQLWHGEQIVEAMNFLDGLAPMYVVPGNHEFDRRTPVELIDRLAESQFDWVADNLLLETGVSAADGKLKSGFTFESGDRTFGIVALTVHPDHGGNRRDHTPFPVGSYIDHADRVIQTFEEQGVDLVIGLTHLHLGDDLEVAKLKARYPKFLFIVGGHEHEPEYVEGTQTSAAVMKGASNARTIWRIDVTFGADGPSMKEQTIDIDTTIELDNEYQIIADKWRDRLVGVMPFLESTVGYAAVPLDGREVAVRNGDSNWGHFIVDQMRTAFRGPPSELALVNGGTLRIDDYLAEDITFEDIGRTFGFSSYLRHMTIDGADFRWIMEAGYRGVGPSKGYFPQISGFRVCVDRNRPDGERIVQLQVPDGEGWSEIDRDRAYTVVAPDFLYRGGDGYDFASARDVSKPGSELIYLVLDAIINTQAAGQQVGTTIDPANPRFAILQSGQDTCFH